MNGSFYWFAFHWFAFHWFRSCGCELGGAGIGSWYWELVLGASQTKQALNELKALSLKLERYSLTSLD